MADKYAKSTGSNTSPYDTWAKAATSPLTAINAAAAGESVYIFAETFTETTAQIATIAQGVRIIGTSDSTNAPPQTVATATLRSVTAGANWTFSGGPFLMKNIDVTAGENSNTSKIEFATTDGSKATLENCNISITGTRTSSEIRLGVSSVVNAEIALNNVNVSFGVASQGILIGCPVHIIGGEFPTGASTVPTTLFETVGDAAKVDGFGVNFASMTSGTVFANNTEGPTSITLAQCKLGAATLNAAITVAGSEYWLYDCSSTDTHYHIAHYSFTGSTTVSTAIYANDGAEYNIAKDKCSWVVAGNANTSLANPYVSPWITRYNESTSSITPGLEILRDGISSAFTDIEVWSEWLLKTAGGSPLASLSSDYGGHLATGAAQGNGVGLAGWTGESGTAWSGKLECPSVTPAEIGHISARVVVAGNHTVYVDPQIRGT